jgi:hypothetical protein
MAEPQGEHRPFRVTIRRLRGDPILRWQAEVMRPPDDPDPDDEIPHAWIESGLLFAMTRAGVERKARRWITWWIHKAQWRDAEVLTIPWPEQEQKGSWPC